MERCKREDLTGQRFGRLTVVNLNEEVSKQKKCSHWNCKCDCGNEKVVYRGHLKSGRTSSCGCYHKEKMKERIEDLTGQRFGRLVVISYNEEVSKRKKGTFWNCKCDCGNEKVVRGVHLKGGSIVSCGCYNKEKAEKLMRELNEKQWKDEEYIQMHKNIKHNYKGGITPISIYLRDLPVVKQWRKDTYIRENSRCQLTGKHVNGGNSDIHHLYGFSLIVLEAHKSHNIQIKPQVKDYTEEELHQLEEYVANWHKDTSNAVLLSEEVHSLFHGLYKCGSNTPEQFEEFRERYMAGEFEGLIQKS